MRRINYGFRKGLMPLLVLLSTAGISTAQTAVGTDNPDPSAALQLEATDKGLLLPRVSATSAVASPAQGLMLYKTGNQNGQPPGIYYNEGTPQSPSWRKMATGADLKGVVIPYASGIPAQVTTVLGGQYNASALVGFGNAVPGVMRTNGIIDLTGGQGQLRNTAFVMPRDGVITGLSGAFSTVEALSLVGSTIRIAVQLYTAPAYDNMFTAVPGASAVLGAGLTGVLPIGTMASGTVNGLAIPLTAGTRCLIVYTAEVAAGLDMATMINGYASGGLTIR